ncbi:hypothetical protein ACFYXP_24655 [Streptomyces sp. NPDC002466]|uniref:hypothetical protein n=1 Tax=Streptomyces sp. NPDC002466 TaxID=3364646 RepID=UPI00367DE899
MASIRTARVLAAVAALPLAAVLLGGVARADSGSFANDGSNAGVATVVGEGASNRSASAQVNGSAFTAIDQHDESVTVNFTKLW